MYTGRNRFVNFFTAAAFVLLAGIVPSLGASTLSNSSASGASSVAAAVFTAAIGLFCAGLFGFSWKKKSEGSSGDGKKPADAWRGENRRARERKVADMPSKETLARTASDTAANFSRSYSQSVDISHLPISAINGISYPAAFAPLPTSEDPDLLDAIDQLNDEGEDDADIRMLAMRIVTRFRAANAVETLSQIALYDLSATLRSKAIAVLADLDHESVFDTIILACADPSREVRAAGARALVKLSIDRGDAWSRAAVSGDVLFGRQVARAAVESGIAERSFDRLAMRDEKAAYEAFALVYLLIRTGETDKIFETIRRHKDLKTRLALLHAIKAANVAEVIPGLAKFISDEPMSSQVADKAREALLGITAVPQTI